MSTLANFFLFVEGLPVFRFKIRINPYNYWPERSGMSFAIEIAKPESNKGANPERAKLEGRE